MIALDRIATTLRIVRVFIACLHLAPIAHKRSDSQTLAGATIFPDFRILRSLHALSIDVCPVRSRGSALRDDLALRAYCPPYVMRTDFARPSCSIVTAGGRAATLEEVLIAEP